MLVVVAEEVWLAEAVCKCDVVFKDVRVRFWRGAGLLVRRAPHELSSNYYRLITSVCTASEGEAAAHGAAARAWVAGSVAEAPP